MNLIRWVYQITRAQWMMMDSTIVIIIVYPLLQVIGQTQLILT